MTINVVAVNGAQSFSPNPATLPAGQMIVWHNVDTITKRLKLLKLDTKVQKTLDEGQLNIEDAIAMSELPKAEQTKLDHGFVIPPSQRGEATQEQIEFSDALLAPIQKLVWNLRQAKITAKNKGCVKCKKRCCAICKGNYPICYDCREKKNA